MSACFEKVENKEREERERKKDTGLKHVYHHP